MGGGIRNILREPLLHFLILGTLLFGLYSLLDDSPPPVPGNALVVSEADALRLAQQFEATWRRLPQPQELDGLIDEYIREEVYVREAEALGLDRGDMVVRRRLQQKMEFLTESGAETVEPTETDLSAHLEANADRFARQTLVSFEQVPLHTDVGAEEVDATLAALRVGDDPGNLGVPSLLPSIFSPSPRVVVDGAFGSGFFDSVAALGPGRWQGPMSSAYGPHLVRVVEVIPGRLPSLDEIRVEVERDWRAAVGKRLRVARYEALRSRYHVSRPDAAKVLGR